MEDRILIVDDEKHVLKALERMLIEEYYETVTFNNPKDAYEEMGKSNFSVVISDQRMPEMLGTEFLQKVAQHWPQTVRILMTGYTDYDVVIHSINNTGIYRFINKPWDEKELKSTFQNAILHYKICNELKNINFLFDDMVEVLNTSNTTQKYSKDNINYGYAELEGRIQGQTEKLTNIYIKLLREIINRKTIVTTLKRKLMINIVNEGDSLSKDLVYRAMVLAHDHLKEINNNLTIISLPTHFCFSCQSFFNTVFTEDAILQVGCPKCCNNLCVVSLSL